MNTVSRQNPVVYGRFLIFIAGMGGLLYGIDVGIVAGALLYLDKTAGLTITQTGLIVSAVFGGSTVSSLAAGALGDWLGRKKMMVASGLLFVLSVLMIVTSQTFVVLFAGRLLQGISGGVIAVVVPLYLAECLGAQNRGKGTAVFQFMLTLGIVLASLTGLYYTRHADAAIAAAHGDAKLIFAAQNHAWRGMFLSVVYPGLVFLIGSFFLSESPRWLFRRGRKEQALAALRRSSNEAEAELQMREMEDLAVEAKQKKADTGVGDSLLQRKYIVPFVLACIILACNQATGINSILSYLVVILRQAGMSAAQATQGDLAVKVLNCVMTMIAIALIDRRGRKFLLTLGTGGIVIALLTACTLFYGFESKRVDVRDKLQASVQGNTLTTDLRAPQDTSKHSVDVLTVLYTYGDGDHLVSKLSDDPDPILHIEPEKPKDGKPVTQAPLVIKRALYGSVASQQTGWLITACLALFIASFAIGPGVVVWLALSELMPTRIRSTGMGIALLINQAASTGIAGIFPSVAGQHGYFVMFAFWAACTVVYFITAAFFLPETKGRTLEEIERLFDRGSAKAT